MTIKNCVPSCLDYLKNKTCEPISPQPVDHKLNLCRSVAEERYMEKGGSLYRNPQNPADEMRVRYQNAAQFSCHDMNQMDFVRLIQTNWNDYCRNPFNNRGPRGPKIPTLNGGTAPQGSPTGASQRVSVTEIKGGQVVPVVKKIPTKIPTGLRLPLKPALEGVNIGGLAPADVPTR